MKAVFWLGIASALSCLACDETPKVGGDAAAPNNKEAKADIEPATGSRIAGEARLSENGKGVKIVVNVKDAPSGKKGIHIHEKGDCSDIAGKSMGSHFAPHGDKHGLPAQPQHEIHLGDLGNIEIKDDGTGKMEITIEKANLTQGDPMSFLGKALVIHEGQDEGASNQPSGGSGKPIACGVISKA
jgi:Cu-Zn family superoxide dismutase